MTDDDRPQVVPLLARCSFLAMTTGDLERARSFWVDQLLCPIIEEEEGEYVIIDAGGLKLCIDAEAGRGLGDERDPVIAFVVSSLTDVVAALQTRGVTIVKVDTSAESGQWAEIRDPDGHTILLTEPE